MLEARPFRVHIIILHRIGEKLAECNATLVHEHNATMIRLIVPLSSRTSLNKASEIKPGSGEVTLKLGPISPENQKHRMFH